MQQHHQHTPHSKMGLNRAKVLLDRSSSISSDLERCSLHTGAEENNRSSSPSRVTVEKLEREHTKLKMHYEELRCQYVQILEEAKEERFEERRVNLLKAQVMQLERQVILLSEGLSSQLCCSQDVEKSLDPLTQRLRSLLSCGTDADVVIARSELTQLVERCEDVKQKLHRSNKVTAVEDLAMPWLLSGSKLTKQPTTLLDLCYGKTNNLNLQQVSALESRLSQLFKHLHGIRQTLGLILAPYQDSRNPKIPSEQVLSPPAPAAVYSRLLNQASLCCTDLDRCCLDLLTLSLIIPSAPWAGPQQRVIPDLEVENILATLPAFPRGAPLQRARRSAQALSRAANYSLLMAQQQVQALETELEFHRSLYSLQVRTIEELVQGIRQAYQTFQENISLNLCAPMQDVLSCYEDLRGSASEAALRRFLSAFKSSSAQIREAVEALGPSKSQGDEVLAQYGRDFLQAVEELLKDCAENREKVANQLHNLQQEHQQAIRTLHSLRAQRRETNIPSDQPHTGTTQQDSLDQSGSSGDPSSTAPEKQPSLLPAQQRHRVLRKTLTVDVTSDTYRHGPSQPAGVNQRLRRRSSPQGKSSKVAARPEWQS
ncbi:uncharacterized protein LOC108423576 [Pygocentrus nattereri]|uniref:uncharacterized protein LOC108423576 n=1 Tax=Pygocentrus nattereri TaxID=42514 RepID=UPI0008149A97|nr:uncharacterized protein LOC108423576 [Pygocentrus nattereri]